MIKSQLFKKGCILATGVLLLGSVGLYAQVSFGPAGVELTRAMVEWVCICGCAAELLYKAKRSKDGNGIVGVGFKYILLYTIALIGFDVIVDILNNLFY